MASISLIDLYREKVQQAFIKGIDRLDLRQIAEDAGEFNLHRIGLAARRIAEELGDQAHLECSIDKVILNLRAH